jgi:hypothetical protein
METIAACAPVYGSSALTPYAEELWSGLQNEVYNMMDKIQLRINIVFLLAEADISFNWL